MLSGCLQRAVCSDPLSSDIREKSDGPTTSAGSAFRNFVLDRVSYDETHGTEYTDADSSRPPPNSSSSKYPQTKAASEPIDRTLSVANDGDASLDGERIFERFYQGSKKEGSTGLGLALVNAVGRYYGLRVAYRFESGRHVFSVAWP